MKITDFITRRPVVQQIITRGDGMHRDAMSQRTRNLAPTHHGADIARLVGLAESLHATRRRSSKFSDISEPKPDPHKGTR
jgi:hypothetical protein